jgi:hypothetical protein
MFPVHTEEVSARSERLPKYTRAFRTPEVVVDGLDLALFNELVARQEIELVEKGTRRSGHDTRSSTYSKFVENMYVCFVNKNKRLWRMLANGESLFVVCNAAAGECARLSAGAAMHSSLLQPNWRCYALQPAAAQLAGIIFVCLDAVLSKRDALTHAIRVRISLSRKLILYYFAAIVLRSRCHVLLNYDIIYRHDNAIWLTRF